MEDEDSYLQKYFHKIQNKLNKFEKLETKTREQFDKKPPTIRLKTSKFSEDFIEVSNPPTLVVRSQEKAADSENQRSQDNEEFPPQTNKVGKTQKKEENRKRSCIQVRCGPKCKETSGSAAVVNSMDPGTISYTLYHDKLTTRQEHVSPRSDSLSSCSHRTHSSLKPTKLNFVSGSVTPNHFKFAHENNSKPCDVINLNLLSDFGNDVTNHIKSRELKSETKNETKIFEANKRRETTSLSNSFDVTKDGSSIPCGRGRIKNAIKGTQDLKLIKGRHTSSGGDDVISRLQALDDRCSESKMTKQCDDKGRAYVTAKNSWLSDEQSAAELCVKREHQGSRKDRNNSIMENNASEKSVENAGMERKETPQIYNGKLSEDLKSSSEILSLKSSSIDPLNSLHCNSGRSTAGSGRKLRSRKLRSCGNAKPLSHDETPVKGAKVKRPPEFDLLYKATLVKREINIGQKLHEERKEREKQFGAPQLVTVVPLKSAPKPNIPRTRRNSILEFFHNKISNKEEDFFLKNGSKSNQKSKKKKEKDFEIVSDVKQLHVKPGKPKVAEAQCDDVQESPSFPPITIPTSSNPPPLCAPISSPQIFRRKYCDPSSSSIAQSATYNLNDLSPLSKKIEELRALKKTRKSSKNLPVHSIDGNAHAHENISQEKTYKKTLPAILKLRKNAQIKRGEWHDQVCDNKRHIGSQCHPSVDLAPISLSYKARGPPSSHSSRAALSPISFPILRTQTPLLPSVIQGLNQNTIKWSNKHGNIFEVTAENGKYGSISCYKDPSSVCQYVFPPTSHSRGGENPLKRKKNISQKLWQDISEVSQPNGVYQNLDRKKVTSHHRASKNEIPDEHMMVLYSNGLGRDLSFRC